ncbi:DUF3775 domain-containing protein [Fluviibacterium sp. DFM31]|uniref:DUF3775 domain-containing protein n=1 Tax=Meridianimarinicoccus marinus TaxID=3231483 RepID=A0ABV3L8S2_9RHOB
MPEIHADTIAQVILLAREMGETTAVGAHDGLAGHSGPAEAELRAFIDALTEDEKYNLVAVAWVGRDSFSADEYDEAYETASQEDPSTTAAYLVGTDLLADYLESGLEALGIDPSDAEQDLM